MDWREILHTTAKELCFFGEEGVGYNTFWQNIQANLPKTPKYPAIYDLFSEPSITVNQPELELDDITKKWIWDAVVQLDFFEVKLVEKESPLKLESFPNWKQQSFASLRSLASKVRIFPDSMLQENVVFGQGKSLNELHRSIVLFVAKSRDQGVAQLDLGTQFNKPPKSLHPIMKKLMKHGLIARVPVIYNKSFTYTIFHSFFSSKISSASAAKDLIEKIHKPDELVRPTFTTDDSKHAVIKTLMTSPNHFLTYSTLSRKLGLTHTNPGCRRRLKRLVNSLACSGHLKRCRIIQNTTGALQFGARAIKPYTGNSTDPNPVATVGARGILAGVPLESQIIQLVHDSGIKGLTTVDLRTLLMGMHVKIFSVFSKRLLSPSPDGAPAPLNYMWEFQGRTRYMRFFTREFFNQLQTPVKLTPVSSKPDVPDVGMDIQVISTVEDLSQLRQISLNQRQSTTAIDRKHLIMDVLNQKRVAVLDHDFRNEVQAKLKTVGVTTVMDRRTFRNTIDLLASESKVGMLQVKVPMLNGLPKNVQIVHLTSVDTNSPEMKGFIHTLQEQLVYQIQLKRTPNMTESLAIEWRLNDQEYQSDDPVERVEIVEIVERVEGAEGVEPIDNTTLFPSATKKTNPFTEEYYLKSHQRLGLLRTRLLRIKMFHLALVELLGTLGNDFSRQNVLSTTSFFTDLSLQSFLTCISMREPGPALFEFIRDPDHLNVAIKELPNQVRTVIFRTINRVKPKVWDLVCPLIALGLMIPLSHHHFDGSGRLLLPQPVGQAGGHITEQHCENFAPYYFLPHTFDMRRIMDPSFSASKHSYSLSSVETAATFWSDLELIATSSDFSPSLSSGYPECLDATLQVLLKQMKHKSTWCVDYLFTLDQRKELESYIDLRRGILPINNSVLFHILSVKFKVWPCLIKNFFFQRLKQFRRRHKKMDPFQQTRYGRLANATLLTSKSSEPPDSKLPRLPSNRPTTVRTFPSTRSDVEPRHRMAGYDSKLDDVLLHLHVISKFRFRGKSSWVEINKYLKQPRSEFPRRRLNVILKYLAGQNRLAGLFNFWKQLYPAAIASGELQEKVLNLTTNEWHVLLPSDPKPNDPYSYLPSYVPILDYNLEEQLQYFLSRSSGDLPVPTKQSTHFSLPDTVQGIFSYFDIKLNPTLCLTYSNLNMFVLPDRQPSTNLVKQSSVSTPVPVLGDQIPITQHSSQAHCYEELFYDLASVVSTLNLSLGQALTTRFSKLSLDDPGYDSYAQPIADTDDVPSNKLPEMGVIKNELIKTAIKMVFLVSGNEFDPGQVSDFLMQFPVQHVDQAMAELRDQGYLTRSKYKTQQSTSLAKAYLNQFLSVPGQKVRLTDRCFFYLTSPIDPQLFRIARLSHQEIVSHPNPPPISPFVTSGAMMALLSLASDLKVELNPEYPDSNHMFIKRHCRDRVRAKDDMVKCNFNIRIRSLLPSSGSSENSFKRLADPDWDDSNRVSKRMDSCPSDNFSSENLVLGDSPNQHDLETLVDASQFINLPTSIGVSSLNNPMNSSALDDLSASIPDPTQKAYIIQTYSLIERCGAIGLPLLLLMMSLPSMTIEQLGPILNCLQTTTPPLIHRVGFDCIRLVCSKHFLTWMVAIQPSRNPLKDLPSNQLGNDVSSQVPMLITPRPWINFDGSTNSQALTLYLNSTLGHIVRCPGISYATLHRRLMFLVNRGDLYELLSELIKSNSITMRCFVQPPPPDPFSPRTQIIEVAPAHWIGPHHPQGVTHYWPVPHAYLCKSLSNTMVASRHVSGPKQVDLSAELGIDSETLVFSCE